MNKEPERTTDSNSAFLVALGGTVFLTFAAFGLSHLLGTPLPPQIDMTANAVALGVVATLPLALLLWWFAESSHPGIDAFRRSQLEFFASIGFRFTPIRIVLISIGAGVSEELLFRGVLQSWLAGFMPVAAAIAASNILFGALHMRTLLYASIAAGVGVYLGVLYWLTDNLATAIITHAVYDAFALAYTQRAIDIAGGPDVLKKNT